MRGRELALLDKASVECVDPFVDTAALHIGPAV